MYVMRNAACARLRAQRKRTNAHGTSPRLSAKGLPHSAVMSAARSSLCSVIRSNHARSTAALSFPVLERHSGHAASAAAIARRVSAAPMSATLPMVRPVAGSSTASDAPSSASHHAPSM